METTTYQVSEQTSRFIYALHNSGAKFYEDASNAIANMYSEESLVYIEFFEKYAELQAMLENCIVDSIAEMQSNVNNDTI